MPRDKHPSRAYPSTSMGEPEIIDRLQYILRPTSANHDIHRDTRQLFDELHAVVNMAARTLDTLTQMKSQMDHKSPSGGRTIELEISASDLYKILMLASGTRAESQQPQQPVGRSALSPLVKPSPCKPIDAANCNSCRFASTCASRGPGNGPAQHSAGCALAAAATVAALFGTGAALEQQEDTAAMVMSPVDVSNILACVQ
ncbi:hypothetical protein GGI24_003506 [Coemansia furcata]|nr:hypothetical protein GGI24_003506 [Coemansia furcata]